MASERTLSILKPDATARPGAAGEILARFERAGLRIVALKRIHLTEELARGFYAVHKKRPFYGDLVKFMTSGPVVVSVLEGEGAVQKHRDLLGPTDSTKAPKGTIRGDFGTDIERNAAHGSDAAETAKVEIAYFFNASEILGPVEALV
jgi:nucleoside-diphosphate kinase